MLCMAVLSYLSPVFFITTGCIEETLLALCFTVMHVMDRAKLKTEHNGFSIAGVQIQTQNQCLIPFFLLICVPGFSSHNNIFKK